MKTIILLLSLSTLSLTTHSQTPSPKNIFKLSFDGFFFGRYQASYERVVGKYTSINLTLGGIVDLSKSENTSGTVLNNENRITGFVASPELRVYLSEFTNTQTPTGFYFGSSIRYQNINTYENREDEVSEYEFNEHERSVGLGLVAGIQYITSFGLGFDAYVGPNFRYSFADSQRSETFKTVNIPNYNESSSSIIQETLPFAGLNISYAF